MRTWSHTRLATYQRCPLAFQFAYIAEEQEQLSPALTRGRLVHEFAERYALECHKRGRSRMYRWGREALASYPSEVRDLCEAWMERTEFNWDLTLADGDSVERSFAVELPDDLGLFQGRCDLVQYNEFAGQIVVTDYKSGYGPVERPERCPVQLACYAWAMREEIGAESVMAVYDYFGNEVRHEWELYAPEPAWAISVIHRIQADLAVEDRADGHAFEPAPSAQACAWCGYRHLCPVICADEAAYPADEDEAADLWDGWCADHARVSRQKSGIRAYIDEHHVLRLTSHPDMPGYYPPDPCEPTPRDVTGDPRVVIDTLVDVLGMEAAARVIDGGRLAEAFDQLHDEGFGDATVVVDGEEAGATEVILEETGEREQALRWHDTAPAWWRREQIRSYAEHQEGGIQFEPEPTSDPQAEERKRLFERARKVAGVRVERLEEHDPLTAHQFDQALALFGLPEDDAALLKKAVLPGPEVGMAEYTRAWESITDVAREGELAGTLYAALCADAGLATSGASEERSEGQAAAGEAGGDPFMALYDEQRDEFVCTDCGRGWPEQREAYQCCAQCEEPDDERLIGG